MTHGISKGDYTAKRIRTQESDEIGDNGHDLNNLLQKGRTNTVEFDQFSSYFAAIDNKRVSAGDVMFSDEEDLLSNVDKISKIVPANEHLDNSPSSSFMYSQKQKNRRLSSKDPVQLDYQNPLWLGLNAKDN